MRNQISKNAQDLTLNLVLVVSFKTAVRLNIQQLFEKNQRAEINCSCSKHLPKYATILKNVGVGVSLQVHCLKLCHIKLNICTKNNVAGHCSPAVGCEKKLSR